MNKRTRWDNKRYYSLDYYNKQTYGAKVYKLSLDANMTCPNRDGKISKGGCIFCSEGGSGDNAGLRTDSIKEQLQSQREFIKSKYNGQKYIAYFQAYTNTYASVDYLRKVYYEAIADNDIVGLNIATRPDCLDDDVMELLFEISKKTKLSVELGLQTIHENTADIINRGYKLNVFDEAVQRLSDIGVPIVVHLILGLPFETQKDILASINYLNMKNIQGIKLQLLHILENTKLADIYRKQKFHIFSLEEYVELLMKCLESLRPDIVIHRLTGDGPKELLIEPKWSLKKINVFNLLHHNMKVEDSFQGKYYE